MTIKRNGDRVILKDGKVSCSCCDLGVCAYYPAIGIEYGLYNVNDLPNEIECKVFFPDFFLMTRTEDEFYGSFEGIDYRLILFDNGGPVWQPGDEDFNIKWRLQFFDGTFWEALTDLADDGFLYSDLTRSLYADTYTISGPVSGSVTRDPFGPGGSESCDWSGSGLKLRYNGRNTTDPGFTPSGNFKWQVNGNNKIGNSSSPVGSYAGGYTVS